MSFTRFLPPIWRKKIQEDSHDMYATHDAIIGAIDYTLSKVKDDTILSKQESLLNEAEGPFLDYWGSWFGLNRQDGWSDDTYREHIKSHVTHPRSTVEGIRQAIVNYFALNMSDVYIYEPFRDIFRWNRGRFNSSYKLHSTYYNTAVIDIQLGVTVPSSIQDLLNWFRMAGVLWVVSYNGSANNPNAPIFDFSSEDTLSFINDLYLLFGYSVYDSFSITPGIYSSIPDTFSEFIWNKSAWNSGDKWLGQESGVTPYVEVSQSALDYTPSSLYSGDSQLFFGNDLDNTDYTSLLAKDSKYVPFSSSYQDSKDNLFTGSSSLNSFTATLTSTETFGNYKMYNVNNSVTIYSNQTPTLTSGDYYIGCYARLSGTASVQVKYSQNDDPVLLSSSYNGNYEWHTIKVTVDDNFQYPSGGIQFIVNGPFTDTDNYIGLFYLGTTGQYTDNSLTDNYVYNTFNVLGFYNKYVGTLSSSDIGAEINSLYSKKLLGYAFNQLTTSTSAAGEVNLQVYNWKIGIWVTVGTFEGSFYSYSINDISPYIDSNGYFYSRINLSNVVDTLVKLNWVGLSLSSKVQGYGINLYSDNSLYGAYTDITVAGYLRLLYGYSIYSKDEIIPGETIDAIPEYSVLSWNSGAWNDGSSWEGSYNSGLPFVESSISSIDYTPLNYLGDYKLFMGTSTSQTDLAKLGSQSGSITYTTGTEDTSNLLYAPYSAMEGANKYPGIVIDSNNKDTLEVVLAPSSNLVAGTYNIGIYACLPTGSSVSVKYADTKDSVVISSEYQGKYQWNYVQVPYTSSDTTSSIIFDFSLPKGGTGYLSYVSCNSESTRLLSGGTTDYIYQSYDLANYFLSKYENTTNSGYADLFSSWYNDSMLGMTYNSLSGNYAFEVYNFSTNHWDSISTLSGTSFSWRLSNYQAYLSSQGVLYTRLHATETSSITFSWLSLSLANKIDGYGTNLYMDNTKYGVSVTTS